MQSARFNWKLIHSNHPDQVQKFAKELKINLILVKILFQRGYRDVDSIRHFLSPSPEDFHDPFLMHDMKKGITRIEKAIENSEKITIYGDYDADGITSTSIMYETLQELGANVDYYIPNRFRDGYGPNPDAYRRIIKNGTKLIITVDNGVAGHTAIALANKLGCDVIITDHHGLPDPLPDAYAIIQARFPGGHYPFSDLCGAGVALKVATALTGEIPQDKLDLAAIGTVADMVSLTDENRAIVKFGLKSIKISSRPGLQALIKTAGINLKSLNEQSISFGIAPRLNALGRMGDANVGVELLTTLDPDRAVHLAKFVENQNQKRKQLVAKISTEAIQIANRPENRRRRTLMIVGEHWHQGVVGIVASRLVEKFHKPSLVLDYDPNKKQAKGSGRSVKGFNLFGALNTVKDEMVSFGGHSMACGLTVGKNQLVAVSKALELSGKYQQLNRLSKPNLNIDAVIPIQDVNSSLYYQLRRLGPFGTNNLQPNFEIRPDVVNGVFQMGKTNQHLRFKACGKNSKLNVVAFKQGPMANTLKAMPYQVNVVGSIGLNVWRNRKTFQLVAKDIMVTGIRVIDRRSRYLTQNMFRPSTVYVFFHSDLAKLIHGYLNNGSKFKLAKNLSPRDQFDNIILVDCPDNIKQFVSLIKKLNVHQLTLYLYRKRPAINYGMPTKDQYIRLFKFECTHQDVDVRHQSKLLASYLQVPYDILIFMIKVFYELHFISIKNGIMNPIKNPQKRSLQNAPAYRSRLDEIDVEKRLLGVSSSQLIHYVCQLITD